MIGHYLAETQKQLTGWKRPVAAMVGSHVDVEAPRPGNFLELPGRTRSAPQIVQPSDHFEHRRQGNLARRSAQASMRTCPVMDVVLHGSVDAHSIRVREELRLPVGVDETDEHLVARLDRHWPASIVNRGRNLALPIRAEGAVEADSFHGIMEQLIIRFRAIHLGQPVDLGKVNFALVRQVVVKQLGKLRPSAIAGASRRNQKSYYLSLIGDHGARGGNDLRPRRFADAHAALQQPPHHMNAVVFEGIVLLTESIQQAGNPVGHVDRLDIRLDQLTQLLGHRTCRFSEREGLRRIEVEENPHEQNGQHHVQLVLGIDTPGVLGRFDREREHIGSEVSVRKIAHATRRPH